MLVRLLHVGKAVLQQISHLAGRLEPPDRVLGVQLSDDAFQPSGNIRINGTNGKRLRLADLLEHRYGGISSEGRSSGAHRVESAAEREKIGALIDRLAPRLFRRHVLRRAGENTVLRDAGIVDGAGQAKIGDLNSF